MLLMMQKFPQILMKKLEKIQVEKNSDYEENFDEEIMEKIQMEKSSDEEN